MLRLTRKVGERVFVGEATLVVVKIRKDKVDLGFLGPRDGSIRREELGRLPKASPLQPIETAPKDGRYILLFGPSGYRTTPLRCEVARWDPIYRPLNPWQTYSNDAFTDGGGDPTHWMELPLVE